MEISHFRGFLGNGGWIIVVHNKKCIRQRRTVTPSEKTRTLKPNHQNEFAQAMRDREDARNKK